MSMTFLFPGSQSRWSRPLPRCMGAGGSTSAAILPARRLSGTLLPVVAAAMIALVAEPVSGQGGATMSAGQSMQNTANSAAGQANRNAGGTAPSSGSLEGYPSSDPNSGEYPSEELGYGYESGVPGGRGLGPGGVAPGDLSGVVGAGVAGSLAEFFNRPLAGGDGFQPTIHEQAALAAHRGDQRLALALFHAHLLAERESAAQALASVRFSPLLRRPVWALRLGISINTKSPPDLAADPQPIRDGDKKTNPGNQNEFSSSAEFTGESSSPETLAAEPLAAGLGASQASPAGASNSLEGMSALPVSTMGSEGQPPGLQLPGQSSAGSPGQFGGIDTAEVEQTLDRDLGLLAELTKAELSRRIRDGRFGSALTELAAKGAVLAAKAPENAGGSGALPMWIPGVEFVGSGIAAQMIEKARANEIDLLVHFEVIVKSIPRSEETQYLARCRVVNVASGDTLGASKLLDRRDVTLAARRSSVRAVVEELLQPAFKALDTKGAVTAMPPLVPQQALARIDSLLARPSPGRMINLAEMAMFHHLGLIDEDQLQQAVYYAAGDEGLLLMYAEYEQRREVAKRMVAKELGQN